MEWEVSSSIKGFSKPVKAGFAFSVPSLLREQVSETMMLGEAPLCWKGVSTAAVYCLLVGYCSICDEWNDIFYAGFMRLCTSLADVDNMNDGIVHILFYVIISHQFYCYFSSLYLLPISFHRDINIIFRPFITRKKINRLYLSITKKIHTTKSCQTSWTPPSSTSPSKTS